MLEQQGRQAEAKSMRTEAGEIRTAQGDRLIASEPASDDAYKIGGDIHPPSLASKVEPEYTEDARLARYQGTAVLTIEIDTDGVARNMTVLRALGFGLDQKAIEAIRKWRFNPGTKDGQPVKVVAHVEVNFRLL
jgi:TonB family protein